MNEVVGLKLKREFYNNLDEHRKRHYTATESLSLVYGGQSAVQRAFGMSLVTIRKGISELTQKRVIPANRIRKKGRGRKKAPENSRQANFRSNDP